MSNDRLRALVLADCRCGGTNLTKSLGLHPAITLDNPDQCQEKLADLYKSNQLPTDWHAWLSRSWDTCNLWHLQRYQITSDAGWSALVELQPRIVWLTRRDFLEQYLSWRFAEQTNCWHRRPPKLPQFDFDAEDCALVVNKWRELHISVREKLADLPIIDVEYEDLEADWSGQLARIQQFLGLDVIDLPHAMRRPNRIDYRKIFRGVPDAI